MADSHYHPLADVHNCRPVLSPVLSCAQGLGAWASFAHQITNLPTPEVDSFVKAAIFATLTNVSCCCRCCGWCCCWAGLILGGRGISTRFSRTQPPALLDCLQLVNVNSS